MDGVELKEVGGALGGGVGVVDADELEIGVIESSAEDEATNAAESIDGDCGGHARILPDGCRMKRREVCLFRLLDLKLNSLTEKVGVVFNSS